MKTVTTMELAALSRQHPDFTLVAKVNIKQPYRDSFFERTIIAYSVVEVVANGDITNSTNLTNCVADELMIILEAHNGAYDVLPRLYALEAALTDFIGSIDELGVIKQESLGIAQSELNNYLPKVPLKPLVIKHADPFGSNHNDYIELEDLEIAVSIDIGDCESGLRCFATAPYCVSVQVPDKTITLEFNALGDNYDALTRVISLESQLEKLIQTATSSKKNAPHRTQVAKAKRLLAAKLNIF